MISRNKLQQDPVVFRLIDRFHRSKGIVEVLRTFKKFKLRRLNAKLVIDTFSEYRVMA